MDSAYAALERIWSVWLAKDEQTKNFMLREMAQAMGKCGEKGFQFLKRLAQRTTRAYERFSLSQGLGLCGEQAFPIIKTFYDETTTERMWEGNRYLPFLAATGYEGVVCVLKAIQQFRNEPKEKFSQTGGRGNYAVIASLSRAQAGILSLGYGHETGFEALLHLMTDATFVEYADEILIATKDYYLSSDEQARKACLDALKTRGGKLGTHISEDLERRTAIDLNLLNNRKPVFASAFTKQLMDLLSMVGKQAAKLSEVFPYHFIGLQIHGGVSKGYFHYSNPLDSSDLECEVIAKTDEPSQALKVSWKGASVELAFGNTLDVSDPSIVEHASNLFDGGVLFAGNRNALLRTQLDLAQRMNEDEWEKMRYSNLFNLQAREKLTTKMFVDEATVDKITIRAVLFGAPPSRREAIECLRNRVEQRERT